MGGGIDALGHSGDDRKSSGTEAARELLGVVVSLGGGVPAANHCQRGPVEQVGASAAVKDSRRIADLEQQPWVYGIGERDDGIAGLFQPGQRVFHRPRYGVRVECLQRFGAREARQLSAARGNDRPALG